MPLNGEKFESRQICALSEDAWKLRMVIGSGLLERGFVVAGKTMAWGNQAGNGGMLGIVALCQRSLHRRAAVFNRKKT